MTAPNALTTSAVNPAVAAAMEVYERMAVVRNVLAPELNDQELSLFALVAQRSGLDPFARQIYAVKRSGRVTFQTGIDGYRSIAERTSEYGGSDEPEFGPMTGGHPEWARVTVYRLRGGQRIPQPATAYWDEFHPGGNAPMWTKMPRNQLAKCAEALALRKAFPYVFADIYTDTEMEQSGAATNAAAASAASQPTARERLAARRAALEQPVGDPAQAEDGEFRDLGDADSGDDGLEAPGASTGLALTAAEFKAYLRDAGIEDAAFVTSVKEQVFPGRERLTDQERGELAAAIVRQAQEA